MRVAALSAALWSVLFFHMGACSLRTASPLLQSSSVSLFSAGAATAARSAPRLCAAPRLPSLLRRRAAALSSSASLSSSRFTPSLSSSSSLAAARMATAATATPAAAEKPADAAAYEENPLVGHYVFPPFDKIKAEHVVPGIRQIMDELTAEFESLEANPEPTWSGLAEPLERMSDRLAVAWGAVTHLKAVRDSEALRKAVETVQPERVKLSLKMAQSRPIYEAWKALRDGHAELSEAQRRAVDSELREAELGGVALEGASKERFNEIQQDLAQLSTEFSNHLLDATKAFKKTLTKKEEVKGLPPSALGLAAQTAKANGHENATPEEGPWVITLDYPSYMPVMQHAEDRALREELYRAFLTRASSGELDNTPLIEKTLALKRERAQLLGYPNHAEVSLASKMATYDKAVQLLEELRSASWDAAVQELDELKAFAKERGFTEDLRQWDVTYWAERMREAKFDINEEALRPYFSLPRVLDGLFGLASRLFGVKIEPADGEAPIWHPDTRFFRVADNSGTPVANFYLDPYSRPEEKRGGAWMDEVVGRSRLLAPDGKSVRLPVAHMVCNGSPPIGDKPSLMTFREVETLFHEFGHALQHMLTKQEEGMVAGIRGVEWDAVELPSQFMENWCYHKPTLLSLAKHVETGETLPEDVFNKLSAARTYRAGSMMMRQLHFAMTDLELHANYIPGGSQSVYDVERAVAAKTMVMPPIPEDRFLCGFSHIFAGGYSAGYYSYKWAEVLSADAFSAFEDVGLDDEKKVEETGRRFRDTVLGMGGGRAPMDVFKDFRGREPSTEPLLRHSGLLQPAAA
eukprot:jgi/Chlat1/5860/Chrsp4S06372